MLLSKLLYFPLLMVAALASSQKQVIPGEYCIDPVTIESQDNRVRGKVVFCLRVNSSSHVKLVVKVQAAQYYWGLLWFDAKEEYPYDILSQVLLPDRSRPRLRKERLSGPGVFESDTFSKKPLAPGHHRYIISYYQVGPYWDDGHGSRPNSNQYYDFDLPAAS